MGLNWKVLIGTSIVMFGGASYFSYQYYKIQKFDEAWQQAKNKRHFMYNIHELTAFTIDNILDQYERGTKISSYRKTLLSYAEGYVLETGVGSSRNIKYYPPGVKVLGIDWSSNILEVALMKPSLGVNIDYKIDDTEQLTLKDNTFDTVVDTFGLDYYVNPEKALNEMKRVCKNNGKILLLCSGKSNYDLLNLAMELNTPYYINKLGYFPNRDWEKIITSDKFNIEKYERKMNGSVYFYILRNTK